MDTTDVVALTVSGSTATAAINPITVSDTRNTYPGWAVSGQDSGFAGSGPATGGSIAGDQLGWGARRDRPRRRRDPRLRGHPAGPGLDTTPGVLASAPAGQGFGTSALGAELTLDIPAATPAGPYSSSLSITAITAVP